MSDNNHTDTEKSSADIHIADTGTHVAEKSADSEGLMGFELPPVTETSNDFIGADVDPDASPDLDTVSEADAAERYRGTLDDKGNPYDPAVHDYPPQKTGKLKKWKRKPKDKRLNDGEVSANEPMSNAAYRGEAEKLARVYGNLHLFPFGNAGAIKSIDDLLPLVDDLERYFLEKGHKEIDPTYAVLISAANYSIDVCRREPNAEKLKRWFAPLFTKIKSWFNKEPKKTDTTKREVKPDRSQPGQKGETWKPTNIPENVATEL